MNGGTFDLNGNNVSVANLSGTGGTIALGAGTLSVNQLSSGTYAGAITGTGSLSVTAVVLDLTLSGTNTYSGGTTVSGGGALTIQSDAALGNVNGGLTLNNGTLVFGSSFNLAATRAVTIGSSGGTIDVGGNNATILGAIERVRGLTKRGTGALTLSGTNDFAGLTIVGNNVVSYVAVSADNQLGTAGAGVTANTCGLPQGDLELQQQPLVHAHARLCRIPASTLAPH